MEEVKLKYNCEIRKSSLDGERCSERYIGFQVMKESSLMSEKKGLENLFVWIPQDGATHLFCEKGTSRSHLAVEDVPKDLLYKINDKLSMVGVPKYRQFPM